ncbi:MAG: hypothetical protein ACRDQA_01365 [Nocardioidaceae bacterium]
MPAGYSLDRVYFQAITGGDIVPGELVYFDAFSVTNQRRGYFDGDTPDTSSKTYAWTGTANASASTRTAPFENLNLTDTAPIGYWTDTPNEGHWTDGGPTGTWTDTPPESHWTDTPVGANP